MKNFWDERYAAADYVFGTEPNEYFKERLDGLKPGKIFIPAAGEGRDAVYAALSGWEVVAVDQSIVGQQKALKLAQQFNVKIEYSVQDVFTYDIKDEEFDVIAPIYFHLPTELRKDFYKKIIPGLKKGGHIILEAFNPKQLNNESGGPKDIEMLLTSDILCKEFSEMEIIENAEKEKVLKEGKGHFGKADVVMFFAKRNH